MIYLSPSFIFLFFFFSIFTLLYEFERDKIGELIVNFNRFFLSLFFFFFSLYQKVLCECMALTAHACKRKVSDQLTCHFLHDIGFRFDVGG